MLPFLHIVKVFAWLQGAAADYLQLPEYQKVSSAKNCSKTCLGNLGRRPHPLSTSDACLPAAGAGERGGDKKRSIMISGVKAAAVCYDA